LEAQYGESLTVNSYEVVLHCDGGTVSWSEFHNEQPTMTWALGSVSDDTDLYVAYGGVCRLSPGLYLLGTVDVQVTNGTPGVSLAPRTHLGPQFGTSFGSRCPGIAGANTLQMGEQSTPGAAPSSRRRVVGDWFETRGVLAENDAARIAAKKQVLHSSSPLAFAVRRVGGPGMRQALEISTARAGRIRVNLYDVLGRRVATLMDSQNLEAGIRTVPLFLKGQRFASGVYLYRVDASEGIESGKVILVH
jgi:hypothetical protein